jgi:uncharacterized protein
VNAAGGRVRAADGCVATVGSSRTERAHGPSRVASAVAVAPIRLYQKLFSPLFGARCKYYPSCSEYAAQAIAKFGILRGLVLAGWRLLRCNPLSHGGFDPVENQRLFKSRSPAASS